jgi:hypothetical protein
MKTSMYIIIAVVGLIAASAHKQVTPDLIQKSDYEKERTEILRVIENESKAFWDKDYDEWANYWVHAPYIRTMGWWERGGITVVKGWEERGTRTKKHMEENPEPNPQNVVRENINIRIFEGAAWVTFDQYGKDNGEPDMDMPGLSRETRFLEKHNGRWKIVYVGWLLEGDTP